MDYDQKLQVVDEILAWKDPEDPHFLKRKFYLSSHPSQGEWLKVGPMGRGRTLWYVGYCVQVRKGAGPGGSNLVLLRHPDGQIVTHENQGFFSLSEEQIALARTIFESQPEDEDYSRGYCCPQAIRKVGFVIEPDSPDSNT